MKKFNYTMNHKADEAYMAKMCHEGWAATSLVEGVWTFEPCKPDQYVYRVCYLRGKSAAEVEALKNKLAAQGIEFVSRYSFWAIFRSEHDFRLYAPEEELAVCESIYRPMPIGSVLSWLAFIAFLLLSGTGQLVDGNRSKWPYRLFEKTYTNFNRMQAEHQAKGEWLDICKVEINPDRGTDGFSFHLVGCPIAKHAKAHGYGELLPYLCKTDHYLAKVMHARLIRTQTEALGGDCCDYWYVGDQSPVLEDYRDLEEI